MELPSVFFESSFGRYHLIDKVPNEALEAGIKTILSELVKRASIPTMGYPVEGVK